MCGTQVRPEQKFCMECGARLHHTQGHDLALAPPERRAPPPTPTPRPGRPRCPRLRERTRCSIRSPVSCSPSRRSRPGRGPWSTTTPPTCCPRSANRRTRTARVRHSRPPTPHAQGPGHWEREAGEYATPWPTAQPQLGPPDRLRPHRPTSRRASSTSASRRTGQGSASSTPSGYDQTGVLPETYAPWEGEWEEAEPPTYGPKFRIRPLLILSILPAVAAIVGMFVEVIDVTPFGDLPFGAVEAQRLRHESDGHGNLSWSSSCSSARSRGAVASAGEPAWQAEPAPASPAGWRSSLGLVGDPRRRRRVDQPGRRREPWHRLLVLCVGAGALGLVVMLDVAAPGRQRSPGRASTRGSPRSARSPRSPPCSGRSSRSTTPTSTSTGRAHPGSDLPTLFFVGRFVQLGLLLVCGVFGFLLVRRYGLGLCDRRHARCRVDGADDRDRADRQPGRTRGRATPARPT